MNCIFGEAGLHMQRTAVTLGKFDGLHLGHQALVRYVKEQERLGLQSTVFTFDYHPYHLFSGREVRLIDTREELCARLRQLSPNTAIFYPFTAETAAMEPERFVAEVLVEGLDARSVAIGEDFRFGRNRRGDAELLLKSGEKYGFSVYICPRVQWEGKPISSTRIREALLTGQMEEAAALLGRPFSISGRVAHGRAIGRTLAFATANLCPPKDKLLPQGVFAARAQVKVGAQWQCSTGVTNIGVRPTVNGDTEAVRPVVETHLFDLTAELYGREMTVELLHFLRPEQRFASLEELQQQIKADVRQARLYFETH